MRKHKLNDLLYIHPNLERVKKLDKMFVIVSRQQREDLLDELADCQDKIKLYESILNKVHKLTLP